MNGNIITIFLENELQTIRAKNFDVGKTIKTTSEFKKKAESWHTLNQMIVSVKAPFKKGTLHTIISFKTSCR